MEKRKIKICYVASVDITLRFILWKHLKFFQEKGYDVSAVCSPGKWIKDVESSGINVEQIGFKRKFSPFSDLVSFIRLYLYFKKEKFHIVHTHTLKPEFYGQIAAKLAGVPIIINTLHGFDFAEDAPYLKKKFFIILETIAAKCSNIIFSIGYAIIETVIKEKIAAPEKVFYLGRDIDTYRFNPQKFSIEFIRNKKKQLGIDGNVKVVGIVARLVAEKGFLELFEAFQEIIKKYNNILLLVVGLKEPEKKDSINFEIVKNYGIENNVMFLGERTDNEELYPIMDVFVLPTHREGLGAVILEASAMERPVIATDVGGCPEAIDANKTGILIPIKNPDKLAGAIIYLLKNPDKAKKMGKAGREKIINEFKDEIIFNRLGNQYKRLIKEKL